MDVKLALIKLDIGSSVAEYEEELDRYFVETDVFKALVEGRVDIISDDKGSGKTALYKHLMRTYMKTPQRANTEIITGFNPSGSPIFQKLAYAGTLTEGQYISIWKTYVFSLVANWLLQYCDSNYSSNSKKLDHLLTQIGLKSQDYAPASIFTKLTTWVQRVVNPKSAGVEFTIESGGIPILTPKVEFSDVLHEEQDIKTDFVYHDDALMLLNSALLEQGVEVWIALDRLDEAFVGYPDIETPALRALLRTYLDLLAFSQIRLKLFVRKDLFRKITREQFVNLTHVNARKKELIWDSEDLYTLLCKRIRASKEYLSMLGLQDLSNDKLFASVFPSDIQVGRSKQPTWEWMQSITKDGTGVSGPRNVVDLANKAIEEQLRHEDRSPRRFSYESPLILADSMKQALANLSKERVVDTLLAESSREVAALIEAFTDSKSDHNESSITKLFGVGANEAKLFGRVLLDIGFFEQIPNGYRIPILYREGLNITNGKAY